MSLIFIAICCERESERVCAAVEQCFTVICKDGGTRKKGQSKLEQEQDPIASTASNQQTQ